MKSRLMALAVMFLLSTVRMFTQQGAADASSNVSFWVDHWAKPRVILVVAAGWGRLYPVCAGDSQECRDRNKLVRLFYLSR
jgi:hypothetical protein